MSHNVMKRPVLVGLLCALALMLTACISMTLPDSRAAVFQVRSPASRHAALMAIRGWTIKGALSLRSGHQKTVLAHYRWTQSGPKQFDILITAPLDVFSLRLIKSTSNVALVRSGKPTLHASNAQALLQKTLGWTLPVNGLRYWVRGLPAPGHYSAEYDQYGHLHALRQSGWSLRFLRYATVDLYDLPIKIVAQQDDVILTFVIQDWGRPIL